MREGTARTWRRERERDNTGHIHGDDALLRIDEHLYVGLTSACRAYLSACEGGDSTHTHMEKENDKHWPHTWG